MQTVDPSVPEPTSLEAEIATEKLKRYNSSSTDEIQAELIQVERNAQRSETLKPGIRKNCHSSGRNPLLYLFIKRVTKLTVVMAEE